VCCLKKCLTFDIKRVIIILMIIFKKEFIFSSLVFLLTITPHACLVEQVIASAAELLPHSHDEKADHHAAEEGHANKTVPSHCHDESGDEATFCCDNEVYFYLTPESDFQPEDIAYPISAMDVVWDTRSSKQRVEYRTYYLHRLKQPLHVRGRDTYALSCLLHAPPRS